MTFKEAYEHLKNADELNILVPNDREALLMALSALKWACQATDAISKFLGRNIESGTKAEE